METSPPVPSVPQDSVRTLEVVDAQRALSVPVVYRDRKVKNPFTFPPSEKSLPDLIVALRKQETVGVDYLSQLLDSETSYFSSFPNVPVIELRKGKYLFIVGDLHGSFYELIGIFRRTGLPDIDNIYLFNGDLIDRGSWSCEILILLLTLSYLRPGSVFINRGNHESEYCSKQYGFQQELSYKYSKKLIPIVLNFFRSLPLATKLILPYTSITQGVGNDSSCQGCQVYHPSSSSGNYYGSTTSFTESSSLNGVRRKSIFIVHAGLPTRGNVTIAEINKVDRFREPSGMIMEQLLWSDPQDENGTAPSLRKFSYLYGPDITQEFLKTNHFSYVIRSHEVADGHQIYPSHYDRLVTIYSCPSAQGYCNMAEYVRFTGMKQLKKAKNWTYIEIPKCYDRPTCPLWIKDVYRCDVM